MMFAILNMLMKKYILPLLQNKPALFDWSVIILSTILGLFFPTLGDFAGTAGFSYWMMAAFVVYVLGAALKDLPLGRRLSTPGYPVRPVPYLILLLIGHWLIMLVVVILSEKAFRSVAGLPPLAPGYSADGTSVFIFILLSLFVTWLVYRTKSNRRKRKVLPPQLLTGVELVADILLFLSITVFTFLFWEKGALAMLGNKETHSIGDVWFIFLFLSILYILVYLPLRYLYFIEDRSSYRRRMFRIFGFLLLRILLDMFWV